MVVVVVAVSAVAAVAGLAFTRRAYDDIGGSEPGVDARPSASPAAIRDEEIRQMVEARNARRVARGEEAVDVESALAALEQPAAGPDPALESEVRDLVAAGNRRRIARGQAPLEVESEVARRLRELGA